MVVIARFIAISCYMGAAALAAVPLARPIQAPLKSVLAVLGVGVLVHLAVFVDAVRSSGSFAVMGLGPALSFAGLVLAVSLLLVEVLAREISLTLLAAPLAAVATVLANIIGLTPIDPDAQAGIWLVSHIALSFVGMAAFATAAAAGTVYLVERRGLKSRRLSAVLRAFPPLETLDRVNHIASLTAWLALTLGVALAVTYSIAHQTLNMPQTVWGIAAWLAVSALAAGRFLGGWKARRAAVLSSVAFVGVIALYLAVRLNASATGAFL